MSQQRVVVIGAGISGLAVAARLVRAGREVLLLESGQRWGGQLHTLREGGLLVELGAEGFVARSRALPALCEFLGIEGSLIDQLTTDTYCLEGAALSLLPPGEAARRLGFQVPEEELGRGIRSLKRGMAELADSLAQTIGADRLRLGAAVLAVARVGARYEVRLEGSVESADALVLATSAPSVAQLLQPLGLSPVAALADAPLMSSVSVNLLYQRAQFERYPAGSGLLFPEPFAAIGLRACSFVEHKFEGRVPAGFALLRAFFRPSPQALASFSEARWISEAHTAIGQVLGCRGGPERAWVSHWVNALPSFSPAYRAQAEAADAALQPRSIHLTGSAFHGAGIDAAVASAQVVATRLLTTSGG